MREKVFSQKYRGSCIGAALAKWLTKNTVASQKMALEEKMEDGALEMLLMGQVWFNSNRVFSGFEFIFSNPRQVRGGFRYCYSLPDYILKIFFYYFILYFNINNYYYYIVFNK